MIASICYGIIIKKTPVIVGKSRVYNLSISYLFFCWETVTVAFDASIFLTGSVAKKKKKKMTERPLKLVLKIEQLLLHNL